MRAIRPIGASSGLIFTSSELKKGIEDVLKAFGSNSAEIWREFSLEVGSIELPARLQGWSTQESASSRLPQTMNELSKQLGALLSGLFDIPEFFDQRLTDALLEFHAWLGYRAECIESQKNRLVQPSTTCQYISQVMKEMTEYVSKVAAALSDFVKGGPGRPNTRDSGEVTDKASKHVDCGKYQAWGQTGTVEPSLPVGMKATFLSGVTATALQYSTMSKERQANSLAFFAAILTDT
ncbi:hypothetical protein FRC05_010891 [Tulasnella sp. 425]|nr:hypothetical protein FRC05_010891 [Tulasnella sp. 425]